MKANAFLLLISVVLAALLGYLTYNIAEGKDNDIVCGIVSTICFLTTLAPMFGIQYDSSKVGINIRALSISFFLAFIVSHFCFAALGINLPYYIIINGIILTIYLAIVYKMQGMNEI